jgi:hypothetical protein
MVGVLLAGGRKSFLFCKYVTHKFLCSAFLLTQQPAKKGFRKESVEMRGVLKTKN